MITTDFCYGYISFSPTGVALQLPGGFSFDLMRLWDGQPIRFVCCERATEAKEGNTDRPLGRVLWCVASEVLEGEAGEIDSGENEDEDEDEDRPLDQVSSNEDDVD